jgi:spore coat protein JB
MERDEILRDLMALDFIAVDLQLFLDTHPEDEDALREYNRTLERAEPLREEYQRLCGPLYSFRSPNIGSWKWYKDPWPWQVSANFDLPEECC